MTLFSVSLTSSSVACLICTYLVSTLVKTCIMLRACGYLMFLVLQVINENRHCIVAAATNKSKVRIVPYYFLYCILAFGVIGVVARLRAGRSGVRIRAGATDFSLLQNVQTGCGAHPDSYSVSAGDSFGGSKAAGVWGWPLSSSGNIQNDWSYIYTSLMPLCLVQGKRYPFYTCIRTD